MRLPKTVSLELNLETQTILLDGEPVVVANQDSIAELQNGIVTRIVARQLQSPNRREAPAATPAARPPSFLAKDGEKSDDETVGEVGELDMGKVNADVAAFFAELRS